jgi:hypothetical protein
MGAEPESRYVRAACPSVLDCLSCGGFSGSPWGWLRLAFLLLVGCSLLCPDVTLSLAWAGCFLLPLCGLFLLLFVSPSICVSLPLFAVFLSGFLLSFAAISYFLPAIFYFLSLRSSIFLFLRSSIFLFLRSSIYLFLRSSIFLFLLVFPVSSFPCGVSF